MREKERALGREMGAVGFNGRGAQEGEVAPYIKLSGRGAPEGEAAPYVGLVGERGMKG